MNQHYDLKGLNQDNPSCHWSAHGAMWQLARYENNPTDQLLESKSRTTLVGQTSGFNLFEDEIDYPIEPQRTYTSSVSLCRLSNTSGLQMEEQPLDLSAQHRAGQVICSGGCAIALGLGSSRTEPGA